MEFINIALEQVAEERLQRDFFDRYSFFAEYFAVFSDNDNFYNNIVKVLEKINKDEVVRISAILREEVRKRLEVIKKTIDIDPSLGMIAFIGDGSWDGHGIIINGHPYVFFDLTAVLKNERSYDLTSYVAHELLHTVHYSKQQSFYLGEYKTVKDKYLKRLIAEGIATFLGDYYTNCEMEKAYWLGVLDKQQVKEWKSNCEAAKNKIGKQLKMQINKADFKQDLFYKLYSVTDSEYVKHRYAYYYGTEIVKRAFQEKTVVELLEMEFNQYEQYINQYFNF